MKCPLCQSKVEMFASPVDGRPIRLCANEACAWEELPEAAADAEAEESEFQYQRKIESQR